jgi:membrane protease YdiL (CAAX protease family)
MTSATRLIILTAIVLAPAFLNDFLYMHADTVSDWLTADYGSKLLILVLILIIPDTRRAVADAWNLTTLKTRPWSDTLAWTLIVAGLVITAFIYLKPPLDGLAPDMRLFIYPDIPDPAVYAFDLSAGLALTAITEELAFRGLMRRVIEKLTTSTVIIVLVSAMVFAAIHWSNGLGNLVISFIAGGLLMVLYLRSDSLWPPVVAHYLTNLILFV